MRRNYSQPSGSRLYQRRLGGFVGVDMTNNPQNVDLSRSPYAQNMIVDSAGYLRKRKGYTQDTLFDLPVNGIWRYKPTSAADANNGNGLIVAHVGKRLAAKADEGGFVPIFGPEGVINFLSASRSTGFQHGDYFYIMDGNGFYRLRFNENDTTECLPVPVVATAPETQIAGFYAAEETTTIDNNQQEQIATTYTWQFGQKGERNLLTNRRINTFCGDGHNTVFYLNDKKLTVYKVEKFEPSTTAEGDGTFTITATRCNVREAPSKTSTVIGKAYQGEVYTAFAKQNGYYKVSYKLADNTTTNGWIYQTMGTYGAAEPTEDVDWVTVPTTAYTVAEDSTKGVTKITFTSAPAAHPWGNGLPNIRVLCAPTERAEIATLVSNIGSDRKIVVPISQLAVAGNIVVKKGTTTLTANTDYTVNYQSFGDDNIYRVYTITLDASVVEDGTGNIKVAFTRESHQGIEDVQRCNIHGQFGSYNTDRFFYTGNTTYRNRDWYSEPDDPTLVLENSYTDIGNSATGIAGYLNTQGEMLIVKFDGSGENVFRRTASSDGEMTTFPVKGFKMRGAVSPDAMCNINGEAVYLTPDGVMAFSSNEFGTKYALLDMSYCVKGTQGETFGLVNEELKEATMGAYKNTLFVSFPNGHCYVADTMRRTAPSETGGYGYEWMYWTHFPAGKYFEFADKLYITVNNGKELCVYPNGLHYDRWSGAVDALGDPIEAIFHTAQDVCDEAVRYKTTNLRGMIIHFAPEGEDRTADIIVYVDGHAVRLHQEKLLEVKDGQEEILLDKLNAPTDTPFALFDKRILRFRHISFAFYSADAANDVGLLDIEYQYRFGRYVH